MQSTLNVPIAKTTIIKFMCIYVQYSLLYGKWFYFNLISYLTSLTRIFFQNVIKLFRYLFSDAFYPIRILIILSAINIHIFIPYISNVGWLIMKINCYAILHFSHFFFIGFDFYSGCFYINKSMGKLLRYLLEYGYIDLNNIMLYWTYIIYNNYKLYSWKTYSYILCIDCFYNELNNSIYTINRTLKLYSRYWLVINRIIFNK